MNKQTAAPVDVLWAQEAEDRLAAYRRGEIPAVSLTDVLSKYAVKPTEAAQDASLPRGPGLHS